jgi:hypothetical protein
MMCLFGRGFARAQRAPRGSTLESNLPMEIKAVARLCLDAIFERAAPMKETAAFVL